MPDNDDTLLTCELNTEKAYEFFRKCKEEGFFLFFVQRFDYTTVPKI